MATVRTSTDGDRSISDSSIEAWDRFPVAGPSTELAISVFKEAARGGVSLTALLGLLCDGHGSDEPSKGSVSIWGPLVKSKLGSRARIFCSSHLMREQHLTT